MEERRSNIIETQVPEMGVEPYTSVSVEAKQTRCPKCQGFIVFDVTLGDDGGWVDDVRCVNCGERFFDGIERGSPRRELKAHRKEVR